LVHEFGHALAGRKLGGVGPVIHLHGLGGLCSFQKANFSRKQDFLMTLAGPMAGYLLCLAAFLAYRYLPVDTPPKFMDLVRITFIINLVWSTINLLPVLPLDGGRLLQAMLGPRRIKITLIIGMLTSLAMIPVSLRWGMMILPILLVFFAFQHFKAWQAIGRNGGGA
jgi:stage IV sporulation protein FB